MTCFRATGDEDRKTDQVSERRVTELVKEVFDNPNWESLGHFSGQHVVTFEAAVSAKVFPGKWKKKAHPQSPDHEPLLETQEVHVKAREYASVPAFLPGKVLQIETKQERLQ